MSSIPASSQRSRITPLVIRSAVVAAIGGLIFGFDTAVISGATDTLKDVFHLSEFGKGFLVAIATIGTIFGAIIGGRLADVYGRRKVLFAIGILYVLGSLGTAFAPTHLFLLVFRMIGGIGVGMSSVCAPIYTAEIAPAAVRGRLVGLVQFNIVLGILLAYLSNFIIRITLGGHEWRWMLGVMVIPSAVFLLLLFTVPETPRWLMAHGKPDEAVGISRQLCSTEEESKSQIAEIKAQIAADSQSRASLVEFFSKRYRKVILLAFAIAAFNQLSGINAILYYAPEVMKQAGASGNAASLMSVAVGFMNLIATMTALTVIWVFISEIFPNKVRGLGQSLGSLTHWSFAALTTYAFPPLIDAWGGGTAFSFFFVCMCGQLFWVLKIMPETKGIPLEDMEAKLGLDK